MEEYMKFVINHIVMYIREARPLPKEQYKKELIGKEF